MILLTMRPILSSVRILSRFLSLITGIILVVLFCFPTSGFAQESTATISEFSGPVLVSMKGEKAVEATRGMVLQAGDSIETQAGAQVVLTLSEGSELRLRQNTKIDIAQLTQRPKTKARKSRVKLLHGWVRGLLSPGHQKKGSSFEVETPNALAGVKFSQPDFEVGYDPETGTTIFIGYTVGASIRNLVTKEMKAMPKAHQAVVQDEFLWTIPFVPGVDKIPPEEKQRQTHTRTLLQSRRIVGGTVSTVPVSTGGRAETSQSPGPGGGASGPRPRTVIINTNEE